MKDYVKIFTGTAILVNRLAQLLDEKGISTVIKDEQQSGLLAGFGTTGSAVELFVFDSDKDEALPIVEEFEKEISE